MVVTAALSALVVAAMVVSTGCGGTPPKPPAGSEDSPLELNVEMDGGSDEPSPPAADAGSTPPVKDEAPASGNAPASGQAPSASGSP
jgi:hypothetical protein